MYKAPYARQMKLTACSACGLVCENTPDPNVIACCPRCNTQLHYRHPGSEAHTLAWLISAMLCYLPANILPVMFTRQFGQGHESTILSGVFDFWRSGSYGMAVLIFTASVIIPCMKFLALGLLLITARKQSTWAMSERTRLYRMTEWIGCWSMLDVVVVAVVCGLVRFNVLSEAEPRAGILFFWTGGHADHALSPEC